MTNERDRYQIQRQYDRLLFEYHGTADPDPVAEAHLLGQAKALLWVLNPALMDDALRVRLMDDLERMKAAYLDAMAKAIDE